MKDEVELFSWERYFSDPSVGVNIQFSRQIRRIPHQHNCCELVVVQSGSGIHIVNGTRKTISGGCVFLIVPGDVHCYGSCRNLQLANVLFFPELLEFMKGQEKEFPFYPSFFQRKDGETCSVINLNSSQLEEAGRLLERIKLEQVHRMPGTLPMVRTLFQELILLLCRCETTGKYGSTGDVMMIGRMIRFISLNYQRNISREDIFRAASCSIRKGNRLFAGYLSSTPMKELLKVRIRQAEKMLMETDLPVSRIALDCGFRDSNYFTTCFHKTSGFSPVNFRKRKIRQMEHFSNHKAP